MMHLVLQHLAHAYATYVLGMHGDQAGWHRATSLVIPDNIRLLPQPAHSPELNPVEHSWAALRDKHVHNQAFSSIEAVEEPLIEGLHQLASDPERVRSMTYVPHFRNIS
jgi:hypothetical protein